MAQQTINLGSAGNDGTGDTLRSGGTKINANFTELYSSAFGTASSQQKGISLLVPATGDTVTMFYTKGSTTVNRVTAVVSGSATPTVTWNIKYASSRSGAGTNIVSADVTTTTTTTGQVTSTFTGTIPADNFVWLSVTSISGTVNEFHVTMDYTG